jgi:hypothetical protein
MYAGSARRHLVTVACCNVSMNQFLRVLCVAVFLIVPASLARADTGLPCWSEPLQKRIEVCTSIIKNPATEPFLRAEAYSTRGLAYSILDKYLEAIADYDKALEINPDFAMVLNNRAWAYFKWQGSTRGMDDVQRSLELDPASEHSWDTRAHLRQLLGQHDGAFADYEAAVGWGGMPTIKMYQCGLKERGMYKGDVNGIYGTDTRAALKTCASSTTCDPLPSNVDFMADNVNCEETVS